MTVETTSSSSSGAASSEQPSNGVAPTEPIKEELVIEEAVKEEAPADEAMKDEGDDGSSEEESDDEQEDEEEEEKVRSGHAPATVALTDASGRPLSDIEIAAQYAAIEIQSMSSQFASAVVDASKPTAAPIVASTTSGSNMAAADAMEDDDEHEDQELADAGKMESSEDEDSSDDEAAHGDEEDPRKLRAEIEAAMEKEENKASGPLKTANEVAAIPVREPEVQELTPDCPIARCGIVLNVSRPGLIVTVKSDNGVKPLDEGSVLCFEDRTVLGCVDEVFGPVLMPMYLVRFENAEKIPSQTDLNKPVFYATEHTTYIIPENIRDKGTDASNIFDEETDETVYSDDEAEAAAKRANRKRNRGGENATGATPSGVGGGPGGNFSDYQGAPHHGGGGGRGRGRSARGRGHAYSNQQHQNKHHSYSQSMPIQAQPHGGVTRYTSPGYGQPGYPPASGQFQAPAAQAYGGAPQYQQPPYTQPPMPMYGQPQYGVHQPLPPYPPQAPPPNYYNQPPPHGYTQPPPPPPPGHYGAPPAGYYQQPPPNAYGQQGHHHQPPPPPPSGGHYGPQGGRQH